MKSLISWGLRLLIVAVFCLSALAKLFAIDHFELYIYSYGFFSLNVSYLLARLCIAAELVLAAFTLLGWYPRLARLLTVGLLLLFSLFLCYAELVGRDESCQCFGQLVDLNPMQSLLKNALLLLIVLLYYRLRSPLSTLHSPLHWWWTVAVAVALVVVPFVVSVPDNWYFGRSNEPYNAELLAEQTAEGGTLHSMGAGEGRCLVAFVTRGCPYCQLTREKLDSMVRRHGIDPSRVVYVEPSDLGAETFVGITYGARPLVLLLDGQRVEATYHLRNIDERQVAAFLR